MLKGVAWVGNGLGFLGRGCKRGWGGQGGLDLFGFSLIVTTEPTFLLTNLQASVHTGNIFL